uniref:Uncharacterized protein n=1 Tax=Sphenodon punctatus TaxID=8508 RepID=A0A8D0GJT6_SPHPU
MSWGPHALGKAAQGSVWVHHNETTLSTYPVWGQFALYQGGGYLARLGTDAREASRVLQHLEQSGWLDRRTRALFVEFTVYNANVDLFCAVTLVLETNPIGVFLAWANLQSIQLYLRSSIRIPVACAQITYLLLILYYLIVQGHELKRQKWSYFTHKGNLLDMSIILTSLAAAGLYGKRHLLQKSLLEKYRQERSRFVSFSEIMKVDSAFTYLIAFLVSVATVKLWNLLQLNPRMLLITQTLHKAWDELLGFLVALGVLLVGYAMTCNCMFGWSIVNFKTFQDSAVTIVGLLIGIFNYEAVTTLDPVLGSLLIVTSVFSMLFVVMNLFVSALLTAFSKEMKSARTSKEESMMQLILLKISALLGIKQPWNQT